MKQLDNVLIYCGIGLAPFWSALIGVIAGTGHTRNQEYWASAPWILVYGAVLSVPWFLVVAVLYQFVDRRPRSDGRSSDGPFSGGRK